ncbi:hypothetical protein [Burkholderia stagnalis]|uniref:hypothetical protein n=1 Tax=Burkholderia stagnalis TaxID=1503054 RepID=UPI000F80DD91|nr:hypothetical protein [Burkholderia stagnalis]
MKNKIAAALLLLIGLHCMARPSYAKNVVFGSGVAIDLPAYKSKRVNSDGSVCIDVSRVGVIATICLYGKPTDEIVQDNGFIKYKNLSPKGVRQVPLLPDDAFVYAEGGYSFLYPTSKKRIGDFIAYEAGNVLCKGDSDAGEHPAVCYVAALVPAKNPNMNPMFFVSAVIEQPPTPGGRLGKNAMGKVWGINSIIKSIKID